MRELLEMLESFGIDDVERLKDAKRELDSAVFPAAAKIRQTLDAIIAVAEKLPDLTADLADQWEKAMAEFRTSRQD